MLVWLYLWQIASERANKSGVFAQMKRTPEQQAARKKIEDAIDEYLALLEFPGVRTNFVIVTENIEFSEDRDGPSHDSYGMMFSNDSMSMASAKGLLYHGLHLLDHGTRAESGDEI